MRLAALTTAGTAALMAASMAPAMAAEPPPLSSDHVIVVDQSGTAAVAEASTAVGLKPVMSPAHGKWAIGVAIGTALASIVSVIGFNGLMRMVADAGKSLARRGKKTAKAAATSAAVAARKVSNAASAPLRWLALASAIGGGAVVLALALDLHWKTSLVVGAASAIGVPAATRKLARFLRNQAAPSPAV